MCSRTTTVSAFLGLLLMAGGLYGQAQVLIMPRVDTTHAVVKRIVAMWSDSIQAWRHLGANGADLDRTGIPGHAAGIVRDWFAQSTDVVATFPATILSVEPEGNQHWVIRTAFSTTDSSSKAFIPFGILRATLHVDDTAMTFVNPLQRALESWSTRTIGSITYKMPPGSEADKRRMRDAADFVERFAETMGVDVPERITYIAARNRDEMCALLGLEYFAFPPQGMSWPAQSVLMVGNGDVAYSHELVHIVLAPIDVSHPAVREGVATLFGGSLGRPAAALIADYRMARSETQVPSFTKLFTELDIGQDDTYILGAAICQQVVAKQGIAALRTLVGTSSRAETMHLVAQWLDIEPGDTMAPLTDVVDAAIASMKASPKTGGVTTK